MAIFRYISFFSVNNNARPPKVDGERKSAMWGNIFLGIFCLSAGLLAAGGVFTVLITVGLVPRFAGKTHTGRKVMLYEDFVIAGTIAGCIVSVFEKNCQFGSFLLKRGIVSEELWTVLGNGILLVFGIFAGMFIGCFALAIAEMLDTIPIFARRIGFRHGLGIAILAVALGKLAGSLVYFIRGIYRYGGS